MLVFGGGEDAGTFEENEAYDPKTDSWTPQYPCSLPSMGAMAAIARVVYVPGSGPVTGGTASSPIPTKPLRSRREGRVLSVVSIFQTG